uniref:Uncharacterized protein n=1 Tax=Anguilla anguilla TaxID=7936 RepID=A0A0E9W0N1_ANGAN
MPQNKCNLILTLFQKSYLYLVESWVCMLNAYPFYLVMAGLH